jgi:carbon starvation protein
MSRIVFNDRLDAALCALFMFVVLSVLVYSIKACLAARAANRPTTHETPFEPVGATSSAAH